MITQSITFRASSCSRRPSATAPVATRSKCQRRACNVHATSHIRPTLLNNALNDIPAAVRDSTRVQATTVQDAQVSTDTLRVITTEGQLYDLDINPGSTTVRNIREAVAQKMNLTYEEVRLAYHGRELFAADDNKLFERQADDWELSAMRRPHAPGPQARELPQRPLIVRTMEGHDYRIAVTPGVTTAGHIRAAVAEATGGSLQSVRLHYAGKELTPANDSSIMQFMPELFLMHTMKRMQGGNNSTAADTDAATVGSAAPRRRRATPQQSTILNQKQTSPEVAQQDKAAAARAFKFLDQTPPGAQNTIVMGKPVTSPGAGSGSVAKQLAKQFRDLKKHPIPGVSAAPVDDDPLLWDIQLPGPDGTPYAGGWFRVKLQFTNAFPGEPPKAVFSTKIWHPNVGRESGKVCIGLGDEVCSVGCVISALQQLLEHPNEKDPLNRYCAIEMLHYPDMYQEKARRMTIEHAIS